MLCKISFSIPFQSCLFRTRGFCVFVVIDADEEDFAVVKIKCVEIFFAYFLPHHPTHHHIMRQRQNPSRFADVVVADFYGFCYEVFVEIFQNSLCTFGIASCGFYFEEDALVILTDYKINICFSNPKASVLSFFVTYY